MVKCFSPWLCLGALCMMPNLHQCIRCILFLLLGMGAVGKCLRPFKCPQGVLGVLLRRIPH